MGKRLPKSGAPGVFERTQQEIRVSWLVPSHQHVPASSHILLAYSPELKVTRSGTWPGLGPATSTRVQSVTASGTGLRGCWTEPSVLMCFPHFPSESCE